VIGLVQRNLSNVPDAHVVDDNEDYRPADARPLRRRYDFRIALLGQAMNAKLNSAVQNIHRPPETAQGKPGESQILSRGRKTQCITRLLAALAPR
jgi:hypothetical protein